MAFDFSQLLYDPMFNFGINMLAANAPSRDPRSSSLAWAMAQGLGGAQDVTRAKEEMENRRAYAEMQKQYLLDRQEAAKEKRERDRMLSMTLAGMLNPPQQVIGQTNDVPGLPPGGAPMNIYGPPNAEQMRQQAMQRIQQLAQVDPDAAMSMLKEMNAGTFPNMPKVPEPPKPGVTPWYAAGASGDELERLRRIAGGLEPNASSAENLRLSEQRLALSRERAAAADERSTTKPLNKTEWNQRLAIQRARASIAKLGMDRSSAEAMAEKDAGFKATLEMANKRMPGDDPAWESTMARRAKTAKTGGKTPAELQAQLDATTDPGMRQLLIERARRMGVTLQDKVQRGGFRSRLGF